MGSIYVVENMANGKRYIGKTMNFKARLAQHKHMLIHKNHENKLINEDLSIYSYDDFKIYELFTNDNATEDELSTLEKEFIKKCNTCIFFENGYGYNVSHGGFGAEGIKLSQDQKQILSEKMKGRIFTQEHSKNKSLAQIGGKNPQAKKVSVNRKIYECIQDVATEYNMRHNTVSWRINSSSEKFKDWYYVEE